MQWVQVLADPAAVVVAALLAVGWGHKYWRKQKKEEGLYLQRQARYKGELDAAKAAWALLRYISEADHEENVFRRGEKNEDGSKSFYFRPEQAKAFMRELMELFYVQGHGLFLGKEVKQLVFELRSQLFGWYHVALKSGGKEMKITNREKLERVGCIREELNKKLKELILIK